MKQILLIHILLSSFVGLAQCEVQKADLQNDISLYSMSEKFYTNENFADGLNSYYVTLNFYRNKSNKDSLFLMELIVTHIWSGYQTEMIPNRIKFKLESGKEVFLTAEKKSSGTFKGNEIPENMNSVECTFILSAQIIKELVESKFISEFIVMDYKTQDSFNLSDKYKGQIPEMLYCVTK